MDLFAFGGPAGPCYAEKVAWQRPTKVISVSAGTARNTSSDQYSVYANLKAADGYAWRKMCVKAGIDPAQLGSLGIGGFSAFHGFANAMCANDEDRKRLNYVHLADACFDMPNPTVSGKPGYVKYAAEAAAGSSDKLMTVTTNGPWGKSISYSWTYPEGDTRHFNMSSGAQCMEMVWKEAVNASVPVQEPPTPPGMPEPTKKMRVGNLIWFHYENMTKGLPTPCGGEYSQHGWHVVALATPMMSYFGAPWMAGDRGMTLPGLPGLPGLPNLGSASTPQKLVVGGVAALAAFVLYRWWTRRRSDYY